VSSSSTWVIAKTVINILGLVVEQCILNYTREYWLLSNALFLAFSIYSKMNKEYQACASLNLLLMCEKFEAELENLYGKMAFEMINVLEPFQAFVVTFNAYATNNMCVLQLDPRFKGL